MHKKAGIGKIIGFIFVLIAIYLLILLVQNSWDLKAVVQALPF
ncbi:MAG TPA: hypothetical protein VJH97_05665 [Candidatus Nanoarchaeia archaeon]|nr:hypothetical protein [Candidatus Nanoarchaeia archaeon]